MEQTIEYRKVEIHRAELKVLEDVSFSLQQGEFCYLVGKVGSGKSSLMKSMYCEVPIESGEASVMGYDLCNIRKKEIPMLRRKLGIVFQDFQLLQGLSVMDNLRFVLRATGWRNKAEMIERIEEVLENVGMSNKSYKMPHELSGGEQQRIAIARALLNHPPLILADEPTGNLDPSTGQNIVLLLHQIAAMGHTILMATHNLRLVDEFPARVLKCCDKHLFDSDNH